jgi:precorrin-3B C17-methyltransferase
MSNPPSEIHVVGLGPGDPALMTPQARSAIEAADTVVGYEGYFVWTDGLTEGKHCIALPLTQERDRAERAVEHAAAGERVGVICSGDPGVYAMAGLVFETLETRPEADRPEVAVVPGVSALNAAAALLGAPLAHDFAAVSLSDLLTPWATIRRRLRAAAEGDFVLALYNPRSRRRHWQLAEAAAILAEHRPPDTPVGTVRNAYRPDQSVTVTTLEAIDPETVDMLSIVIVGSSQTRRFGSGRMLTPRGYAVADAAGAGSNGTEETGP